MPKHKILIIDDNKQLLDLLKDMLSEEGFEVVLASNGTEGIKKHRENKPDIILMDLKMPKIDGIKTAAKIRTKDKKVIIIILTAYGSVESAAKAAKLNIYGYITKPFKIDELKNTIKKALALKK